MGFFGKIKQNLNHGGVKIDLQAPGSANMQDATIEVSVTLTNGPEARTVNKVIVEIIATSQNQGFNQATASDASTTTTASSKTVASSNITQPFILQAGESKTLALSIVMNGTELMAQQLPQGSPAAGVLNAVQQLQKVSQAVNGESWSYRVQATADVEGIALDPSVDQPITIFKPGQIGSVTNFKL